MVEEISALNRRIHEALSLLHKSSFRNCLFSNDCSESVVNAHAVSQSILRTIEYKGHLKSPQVKYEHDTQGHSRPRVRFANVGIQKASIGTFACQNHEEAFRKIDTIPMDFQDSEIVNLLLYRAVLREIWLLSRMREFTEWADDRGLLGNSPANHPYTRLKSLLYFRECIRSQLMAGYPIEGNIRVQHRVRRVKSDSPILAASTASGGSVLAYDPEMGDFLSAGDLRSGLKMEPYTCWGLNIIPQEDAHMILTSWLKGSHAETYFEHIHAAQGRGLEEAVSAELILFSENWFLNPKVWGAYGIKKREAILTAFTNFEELMSGQYNWLDKSDKTPWYEYLKIPNRHQLNLFRYAQPA